MKYTTTIITLCLILFSCTRIKINGQDIYRPERESYIQVYVGFQNHVMTIGHRLNMSLGTRQSIQLENAILAKALFKKDLSPKHIQSGLTVQLSRLGYQHLFTQIKHPKLPTTFENKFFVDIEN